MSYYLENSQIGLRRFAATDLKIIMELGQDNQYHQLAGFAVIRNHDEAKQVLNSYQQRPGSYVIESKTTGEFLGFVELNERGLDERSGLASTRELGFLLRHKFWGQGIMTAALILVIDSGFITQQLTEIWAAHYEINQRSEHLLLKLGFQYKYDVSLPFPFIEQSKEKYYLLTPQLWERFRKNKGTNIG